MNPRWVLSALLLVASVGVLSAQEAAPRHDRSPHIVQFVSVDENVKLEVLDWGGSGRALVLLAGLGNTAHVFDDFAPKLTSEYHVYGVTRRGYGASSAPVSGYSADRLGDDVLAVLDALNIDRTVLVGHSIAGEELSSVGSRHPERVAGLIYLDASGPYAYYDRSQGDFIIDWDELKTKVDQILSGEGVDRQTQEQFVQELLQSNLPTFAKDLQRMQQNLARAPQPLKDPVPTVAWPEAELHQGKPNPQIDDLVMAGEQKYTNLRVPILAIFANGGALATSFEAGVPSAHVVRLAHANHYIFMSNEADVLREMLAFLAKLH